MLISVAFGEGTDSDLPIARRGENCGRQLSGHDEGVLVDEVHGLPHLLVRVLRALLQHKEGYIITRA